MKASPGDWLIVEGLTLDEHRREGLITEVRRADGSPPYVVRWLDTEHATLVFPGPDARVQTAAEHEARHR